MLAWTTTLNVPCCCAGRSRHLATVAFSVLNSSRRGYPGDEGAHIAISKWVVVTVVICIP